MKKKDLGKYTKVIRVCGILIIIAGVIITAVSALYHENDSYWRLASGVLFVIAGITYILTADKWRDK